MGVWRYGIYLRVFTSISNEWDIECEHEKINSISPSVHVLFCLLYKHTDNGVFDDFPKISDHFPKIFQIVAKTRRTFPNILREFPKFSEDVRRLPKTFEEDSKMFRWHTNKFKYNLRDKPDVSEIIDIFTCEIIVILPVKIYGFSQWQKSW